MQVEIISKRGKKIKDAKEKGPKWYLKNVQQK